LRYGLCEEVFNILNAIFEGLRQLATTALNPPVLILILCFVQELEKADMQPRAHLFLSYLAKLSKIVHGAEHPVRTVTYSILQVASPERLRLVDTMLHTFSNLMRRQSNGYSLVFTWSVTSKIRVDLPSPAASRAHSPEPIGLTRDRMDREAVAFLVHLAQDRQIRQVRQDMLARHWCDSAMGLDRYSLPMLESIFLDWARVVSETISFGAV
jgi:hypothetical protein